MSTSNPISSREKRTDFDVVASKANSTASPEGLNASLRKIYLKLKAKQRQGTRTDIVENLPQCEGIGETRDKVAETIGLGKEGMTYQAIADKSGVADETVRKSVSEIENSISEVTNIRGQKRPTQYKTQKAIFANGGVDLITIGRPSELK